MPKVWTDDTALMEGMTDNLFEALYKMPKYFLRIDDIAHSLEMPISSLLVLCVLREGKISIGEISERLCIAKPNVTPLVETLCARGLISRQRSDKDRRKVLVGLMPEGEAMVERIRGAIRDQMMSWPRDYNLSEMKRVNNALAATLEVADDVMRRRPKQEPAHPRQGRDMPVLFMWIFLLRIFLRTAEQHRQHAVLRGCMNLHTVRQQIHKREVAVIAHGGIKKLRHIHRALLAVQRPLLDLQRQRQRGVVERRRHLTDPAAVPEAVRADIRRKLIAV